jgi:putative ABC transport system substrate-binding protein
MLVVASLLLSACATPQPKTYSVAFVNTAKILDPVFDGFKGKMTELGYTEGKNITYVWDGDVTLDKVEELTKSLVAKKVDLIFSLTTPATQAVKKVLEGTTTPAVFSITDPVAAGVVQSLKQPGGNMTGITTGAGEALRFEWLMRIVPKAKRIYYPYNSTDKSASGAFKTIQATATNLKVEIVAREATTKDDVTAAIAAIPTDVDAIFIGPDSLVGAAFADWAKAAIERKLPLSGSSVSHVQAGMLFSYSYDNVASGQQVATIADQVLKGTKPADIPVQTSEFFLTINYKTAQAIGLDISNDILQQAKTVIK